MLGRFFNRYTPLAVAVQIIAIVQAWIVAFAISPVGDKYFGLMFSFYLPPAYVAFELLKLPIVSGIVGGAIQSLFPGKLLIVHLCASFDLAVNKACSRYRSLLLTTNFQKLHFKLNPPL